MAGTYNGSSVEFPGTTAVVSGMPSGSRAAAAILNWGRFGKAVVVKVGRQNGFSQESGKCGLVLFDPGLNVIEAVVALRDDEE